MKLTGNFFVTSNTINFCHKYFKTKHLYISFPSSSHLSFSLRSVLICIKMFTDRPFAVLAATSWLDMSHHLLYSSKLAYGCKMS